MEIKGTNEFEHLILKYNDKINKFEDITKRVIYLNKNLNSWYIVFENKQTYHIKLANIKVSINPININIFNKDVLLNDKKVYVKRIIRFDNLGFKVFFEKTVKYYSTIEISEKNIQIVDFGTSVSNTQNVVVDYYKNLSKYASDISKDEISIETLLYKIYNRINHINPSSVLYSYTSQRLRKIPFNKDRLIYPFSTNNSQNKALYNTFTNNLSVISGPPGTGKTQIILNIIANAIYNNRKIAVISNNNTAVENVYLKMKEYDLDFLLAYLGNRDNVNKFFLNEIPVANKIERFSNFQNSEKQVCECSKIIENLYKYNNDIKQLEYKINKLEEEQKHFNNKNFNIQELPIPIDNYEELLKIQKHLISIKKLNFIEKIILKLIYKINIKEYSEIERILLYLNKKSYQLQLDNLRKEKENKEKYIKDNNLREYEKSLKQYSFESLGWFLYTKYKDFDEVKFTPDTYKEKYDQFTFRYPVTLSTTHSLLRNCPDNYLYDLVIIDEASQSDIMTSLITMNVAKSMVIIGDDKQLSQIDNQDIYEFSDKLIQYYKIPNCYQYKNNSILESVIHLPIKVENTLLREHYRCEYRIIDFCNKKFYNDQLIICSKKSIEDSLSVVHTIEGNHSRKNPNGTGQYNDREVEEILKIISENPDKEIGIITPFRAQADYILSKLYNKYPNVEVDTIHKYQGRQKEIIILSTVVNELSEANDDFITNFITNPKLLNVAISRAISKLYLVVSDKVYKSKNNNISHFIEYIKYNSNLPDISGQVTSVFDELYKQNYRIIQDTKLSKKVDSAAEGIMLNLLKSILKNYPTLSLSLHVNLLYLIDDLSGFTEEEIKYIKHPWTHVDFVIYDKVTYKNVLCIELDGTKYHDYSKRRVEKDMIKTKVLINNNINFLRIRTNESGEKNKIIQAIEKNI